MKHKKVIAGVTAVVLVLGLGVAYAAWTVNGTGSGTAKAATAQNITLTGPAITTGDLYPGFAGGDLQFEIANPNNFPVRITALTAGAITSSAGAACDGTNIAVSGLTGLTVDVPANATAAPVTLVDKVSMVANAADACQGATFTVTIAGITAASNA